MIIEQLTFRVAPNHLEDWLTVDAEVWDPVLAACPGYLGKEVWITDVQPGAAVADESVVEVQVIVRWTDRETWKSISDDLLRATHDAMGVHAQTPVETVHITADRRAARRPGIGPASA